MGHEGHVRCCRSDRLFHAHDSYLRSPESGGVWYKSRQSKMTIWSPPQVLYVDISAKAGEFAAEEGMRVVVAPTQAAMLTVREGQREIDST